MSECFFSILDAVVDSHPLLEGWEHVYTVNLGSVKHVRHHEVIPFARLAKRVNANDNCLDDYLITFRVLEINSSTMIQLCVLIIQETQSAPEWGINVSYNQILEGDTLVHRGFHTLARGVFALFNPFLRQADEENRLGLMTVTGGNSFSNYCLFVDYYFRS